MSKYHNSKRILSFRNFEKLDADAYVTYDLAWPVEIVECYANKVADDVLDGLAEAVLGLLNIPETSPKKAAGLLHVSEEITDNIVKQLQARKFIDISKGEISLTEIGKKYISDKDTGEFQEEKVFGNMFVSRINGDVFPYFHEGKLPWAREFDDILYLSYDADEPSSLKDKHADVLDRINKAFHRYGRITKSSRDYEKGFTDTYEIDFIEEELREQSFDEEPATLAQKEAAKALKNARIKTLKTPPVEAYIRARLVVSKAEPKVFRVESPFPTNITSWYSDCFHRMKESNELIYDELDEETGLEYFCENITTSFYIKYPEMQGSDFEQFVKIRYPKMLSCSISIACLEKYREIFRYNLLCKKGEVSRNIVVTETAKAIEMILNSYIRKTRKNEVVSKYWSVIQYETDVQDMMDEFGISGSAAERAESKRADRGVISRNNSLMSNFVRYSGKSIMEKYYFLIVDAYFNESSHFRKLLINEGSNLIMMLDYLGQKRNKFGAHNDGENVAVISEEDFKKTQDYLTKATRILLDYLD